MGKFQIIQKPTSAFSKGKRRPTKQVKLYKCFLFLILHVVCLSPQIPPSFLKLKSWNFESSSDGSGSKIFEQGRVSVSFYWIWKISAKIQNFSIFFLSGQIKSHPVRSKSTRVKDLLFSADPKYARVKSDEGPSLDSSH